MSPSTSITIIGGGTAGHFTAIYLANNFPDKTINWIFPEGDNAIGVGEATVPYVIKFLKESGISVKEIIQDMKGTFKLGVRFDNFFEDIRYHPFGNEDEDSVLFLAFMKLMKVSDKLLEKEDHVAMHFDVKELYPFLYKKIIQNNNINIQRRFFTEEDISGDTLVIDCTGFERRVRNLYPNEVYRSENILNDRAIVAREDKVVDVPFSIFTAFSRGWFWQIPLQDKTSYGYIYSSQVQSDEEALKEFKELKGDHLDYSLIPMAVGRNKQNMVRDKETYITAVGLSSSFIEPLESTGLYFTCYNITLLGEFLNNKLTLEEYNHKLNDEFDSVENFIVAHFKFSTFEGHSHFRDLEIKETLSNIFVKRSWEYLLNEEYSLRQIELTRETIQFFKELKSTTELYKGIK